MIFRHVNRGYEDTAVLVPGWACDYRIFASLDLRFNYLLPLDFSPFNFEKDILAALKRHGLGKISLFGHSLGGFAASDFASRHPDRVVRLIMVSVRKRYPAKGLTDIRAYLYKNKKAYLYRFYHSCFPNREKMAWFRGNLLKRYCEEADSDRLLEALEYLEGAEIKTRPLKDIRDVTMIHGSLDRIAPIEEAVQLKEALSEAGFITVEGAGHMPFLTKGFSGLI